MSKYIARRLLLIIPTLIILTLLVFGLMRVLPGDVATRMLSDEAGALSIKNVSADALRAKMGLDRPLYLQYLNWLWDLARGDLGESLLTGKRVGDEIIQRLPVTFQIALMAQILSLVIGIPVGIISAVKQNSWMDLLLRFWSILFLAAPSFWLATLFILVAALQFNWLPPMGYHSLLEDPKGNLLQLVWPSIILAHGGLATIARMTRSTMLEVMREDYIRTARAKGLKEQVVIIRHALKNALIPVVTLAGLSFAGLMGGTVILEQIFAIPGMGSFFISAIRFRDYPIVQGTVIVFAVIFMLVNLLIDLMYGWLDPRISYS
ncbi:MAG: ABC transporter permease [Dehalococcoidia bacterium]|nr:ABC transporter permease [Dehalococcoidia bacterium]